MAVGLNKAELVGEDSVRASRLTRSVDLPASTATVSLSYPGKLPESDILTPVQTRFSRVTKFTTEHTDALRANGFIWGDNWLGMHSLLKSHQKKVQLIYLDPPYATGMDFSSRSQEHAYNDSLGQASYIESMRRRFILMRELLADDGSIYIHIGHQMVAELKLILDEVFGPQNFRNIISRRKCSSKNSTRNQFANLNDYVLFYTKSSNYIWNQPKKSPSAEWVAKEYPKVDSKGQYKLVPVHAPGIRNGATGEAWRGMLPPPGKHWQYTPSKLDELDRAGEIYWSKTGNPRRKVYLVENKGLALTDYWDEYRDAHHQSILITGYPTEKNFDMMKMIVSASSLEGGLVIDPFTGSGSTIHAADVLNRQWIGMDESFLSTKTVISRLQHGRQPMGDFVGRENPPDLFTEIDAQTPLIASHESGVGDFELFVDAQIAEEHADEVTQLQQLLR